jgi:biotin carboxyl carrier protein
LVVLGFIALVALIVMWILLPVLVRRIVRDVGRMVAELRGLTTRLDRIAFLLDPKGEADTTATRHKAQIAAQVAQKQAQIAARASQQQAEVAAEAARQKAAADRERARIELAERENIAAQLAHLKGPAVVTPPGAGR